MTRNIWITSDTHLFHKNMLNWDNGRPEFSTVDEMNECILEHWNECVKTNDIVYHLGDVHFGSKSSFEDIWPQFHGSHRLVIGNHDDVKHLCSHFKKVMMWRDFSEWGLLLSHVPLHPSALERRGKTLKNVHGHVHRNSVKSDAYINVCVENTNYKPINIEELKC